MGVRVSRREPIDGPAGPEDGLKTCTQCSAVRPLTEFRKHRHGKDGLRAECRTCENARKQAWRKANPEKSKQSSQYKYWLKAKYGLTLELYEAMASAQSGRCAICKLERKLVVDHCHSTGRIRGLLCKQCNSAIGLLADDTGRLEAAIEYLA